MNTPTNTAPNTATRQNLPRKAAPRAGPKPVPLALMRATVTALALAVFAQPVLAGLFLGGNADMIGVHGGNGALIELLALVQIIVAVVYWRPGHGPAWPILAGAGIFLAVFAQAAAGYVRLLALHLPLGVTLFAVMFLLLVQVWRPDFGRRAQA